MSDLMVVSNVALWILFLVMAIALLSVLRNLGVIYDLLESSDGQQPPPTRLRPGDPLPELTLRALSGEPVSLGSFRGTKTAFSIVSPHCSPCFHLLQEIAAGNADPDPIDASVRDRVVLSTGNPSDVAELLRKTGIDGQLPVLVDEDNSVTKRWGITRTPATVIVDQQMRVVRHVFATS